MLGISSVLQLFLLWITQPFTFHFIDLKFVLGGARFHCGTFEVMYGCVCPEACTDNPVTTWHMWTCVDVCTQKLVQTVLSSHDMWTCVPRSLYRQSCHHVRYVDGVPRSLYRQSCRHMNLLFSVSFQVNGDIPPRLKVAHEIILDFIRSRPPLNPVCDLILPMAGIHVATCSPHSLCHRTQLLEECWRWAFSDCEAWLWTQGHIAFVCIAALYLRVQTPHLGYRKSTAASSFTVAMALCSWGSSDHGSGFWSGLRVGLCLLCSPLTSLAPQPALSQGLSNPCTFSNLSN